MINIKSIGGILLRDDNSSTGGLSHSGETLEEFLASIGERFTTINSANAALAECGIQPITAIDLVNYLVRKVDEKIVVKYLNDEIDVKRLSSLFYGGGVVELKKNGITVRISACGDVEGGLYRYLSEDVLNDDPIEDVFEVEDRGDGGLFGMRAVDVDATSTDEKLRGITWTPTRLTVNDGVEKDGIYAVQLHDANWWQASCYYADRPESSVWERSFDSDNLVECVVAGAEELLKEVKNGKETNA